MCEKEYGETMTTLLIIYLFIAIWGLVLLIAEKEPPDRFIIFVMLIMTWPIVVGAVCIIIIFLSFPTVRRKHGK